MPETFRATTRHKVQNHRPIRDDLSRNSFAASSLNQPQHDQAVVRFTDLSVDTRNRLFPHGDISVSDDTTLSPAKCAAKLAAPMVESERP